MEGVIQDIVLDMTGGSTRILKAKQCDTNSRFARITLMNGAVPWMAPFDSEIYLYVLKPDKKTVFSRCDLIGQSTIIAPLTEQTLAVSGTAQCEVYVKAADGDIKSQTFTLVIEKMIFDEDMIESSDEFNGLYDKLNEIQILLNRIGDTAKQAEAGAEQANAAAGRAEDAAGSIRAAATAAEQAGAARETVEAIHDYMESEKNGFAGYFRQDSDRRYANALINTVTGTGSIFPANAWAAPVRNIQVSGKSEQAVIKGSQLFDATKLTAPSGVNIDIVEEGRYIRISSMTETNYAYAEYTDNTLIGKTVYMIVDEIIKIVSGPSPVFQIRVAQADEQNVYYDLGAGGSKKVVIPGDAREVRIRLLSNNTSTNAVSDRGFVGTRICDAPDSAWEPYSGGERSPAPTYPQTIQSVKELVLVSSMAPRNYAYRASLRNQESYNSFYAGGDITKEFISGEYTKFIKSAETTARAHCSKKMPGLWNHFKTGDDLTMSAEIYVEEFSETELTSSQVTTIHIRSYNADKTDYTDLMAIKISRSTPVGQWQTVAASDILTEKAIRYGALDAPIIYVSLGAGTYVIRIRNIKLEKGKTPTPYVPAFEDPGDITYSDEIDLSEYTFRGLNDDRDTIQRHNDQYGIVRMLKQKTISDVSVSSIAAEAGWKNAAFSLYHEVPEIRITPGYSTVANVMSDRFLINKPNAIADIGGISNQLGIGGNDRIFFRLEGIVPKGDKQACAEWIAANPFDLLYPLEEPVWEPFPDVIQKKFQDLLIYPGEHAVVYAVTRTIPALSVEYVQDSNKAVEWLRIEAAKRKAKILAAINQLKIDNNLK